MENISLIKVHSLYLKNVFNLYEKIGNYLLHNAIVAVIKQVIKIPH